MNLRFPFLVFFLGVLCATTPVLGQTGAPNTRPIGPNPQPPVGTPGVTLFAYGPTSADTAVPRSDDGSTDIAGNGSVLRGIGPEGSSVVMNFGGTAYNNVYVNVNGLVSFGTSVYSFLPQSFPVPISTTNPSPPVPMIAPYWADADIRPWSDSALPSGNIWYRTTTDAAQLAQITSRIESAYAGVRDFTPTFAQIVTWDKVRPYGRDDSRVNTFQAVIASNGVETYTIFLYPKDGIWWDHGAASGSIFPSVGYYANSEDYFNVPGSLTPATRDLWFATNTADGQKGTFVFDVGGDLAPIVVNGTYTAKASATSELRFSANPAGHTVTAATAADSITFGRLRFDDSTDRATFDGQIRALAVVRDAINGGNLTFAEDSVLVANASNAINGGSIILSDNAKLALYAADATTATTSLAFTSANATLDLRGFNTTLGTLHSATAGDGRIINSGANPVTLTLNPAADGNFRGAISNLGGGALSLVMQGSATQILSGTNTYTGSTTLAGGVLNLGSAGALNPDGGTLLFTGGTLQFSAANATDYSSRFSTAAGQQYRLDTSDQDVTLATGLTSSGATLTKFGAGTLTLTGLNTYTGGTTLAGGTLQISANTQLGGTTGAVTFDGGTLTTTGSFDSTRATTLAAGGGTFAPSGSTTLTWAGALAGAGSLIKSGGGTLVLSGVNTHSGGTTISAGTLSVSHDNQLGSLTPSLGALTLGGGTLLTTTGITSGRNVTVADTTTSTINTVGFNNSAFFTGAVSGTGNLIKTGAGRLILSGPSLHSGNTTIDGGELVFGSSANLTYGGNLSGPAAFQKSGAGKLILTGDHSNFTGTIFVSGGILQFGDGGTSGSLTGDVALAGMSVLAFNRADASSFAGSISGAGSFTKSGPGTLALTGINTYTGGTTLAAGTLQISADTQLGGTTGAVTFDGGTLATAGSFDFTRATTLAASGGTIAPSDNTTLTWTSPIIGSGILTKSGGGTLVLSGINTHSGGTTISTGTLSVSHDNQLGSLTGSRGDLTLNGGTLLTTTGITSFRVVIFTDTTTSTINVPSGQTSRFGSVAVGTGSLIKTGTGTLIFSNSFVPSGDITLNDGTLAFTHTSDHTYRGNLSGPAAFQKLDIGSLTLTGNNATRTGDTALVGGTLNLGSADALNPDSGTISFTGGTLQFSAANATDYSHRFSTAAGQQYRLNTNGRDVTLAADLTSTGATLTKSGAGTLTLVGANTYTGGTAISGGTLQVGDGASGSFTGNVTVATNSRLVFNQPGATSFAGVISGGGSLTQAGAGTLTLTGVNTYTGGTTLSAGTLQISANTQLGGTSGTVTFDGGTLATTESLNFTRATTLAAGGGTIAPVAGTTLSWIARIGGAGTLTKSGDGTLILSGINTHSGGTTISAGTLSVSSDLVLGSLTSSLTLGGGTLLTIAISSARNLSLANATTSTVDTLHLTSHFTGAVSGTGSLIKTGNGTLILSGSSLHSGNTTLDGGTLDLNHSADLTYGGNLSGAAALRKSGTGTLTLTGDHSNFSGSTTLDAGSLAFNPATSYTLSSAISGAGAFTKSGATTLTLTGNLSGLTGATTISDGRIDFNPTTSYTLSSAISGSGAFTKSGAATLTLTANNASRTGDTTLAGGTLNLGSAGALNPLTGTISFTGGTLQFSANNSTDYSGRFSATAGQQYRLDTNGRDVTLATGLTSSGATLTKSGAGTLTLTGLNTFTGTTTIEAGTLRIGGDSSSLNSTGGIVNQGTLVYARTGNVSYNGVISGVGSLVKEAAGTLNLTGNLGDHTFTGGLTLNAGSLNLGNSGNILADILPVTVNAGTFKLGTANETIGSLAGTGGIVELFNGSGRTLTVGGNVTSTAFAGVIQGTGGSLTKTGSGTQILAGANTYTGSTTITGGTLQIGNGGTSGSLASNSILNNAALVFNRSDTSTYTGVISGSGSLTKNGAGTLTLSGANTFTGATNITAGRVNLTGSAVNSTFVLSGGGLLSGTGRVGGLTIDAGGIVSPGNSSGTLFVDGASTFGIGGSMTWELNATAFAGGAAGSSTGWDLLSISGALNIAAMSEAGNTFTIRLVSLNGMNADAASGFDGTANYVFDFVTAGSISGFSADKFTIDASAFQNLHAGTWSIGESGGSLLLSYAASASPIPEPSTYAAFAGVAALGLAAWRRRDRKSPPE